MFYYMNTSFQISVAVPLNNSKKKEYKVLGSIWGKNGQFLGKHNFFKIFTMGTFGYLYWHSKFTSTVGK